MKFGAILVLGLATKKLALYNMRVLSEERTHWPINHRASRELWDLQAEILTELSRRDNVSYRVRASDETVAEKLANLEEN